jgi:peroxiredoxin
VSRQGELEPLTEGDNAPPFTLPDLSGGLVSSAVLLRKGPVVVTFYRGLWCPYCQLDLQALEAIAAEIHSYGTSLVAISHQTAKNIGKFPASNRIGFPVLDDRDGDVAVAFGIRWAPADLQSIRERLGADLSVFNDGTSWILPMQARYVIAQDGVIVYADVNSDYTQRSEPSEILPVLHRLKTSNGDWMIKSREP